MTEPLDFDLSFVYKHAGQDWWRTVGMRVGKGFADRLLDAQTRLGVTGVARILYDLAKSGNIGYDSWKVLPNANSAMQYSQAGGPTIWLGMWKILLRPDDWADYYRRHPMPSTGVRLCGYDSRTETDEELREASR